ncbi:hypothetical protein HYC85_011313 [Camellia sinensis]|uniref:Uncharacterized protein n=1 Tax=Camellia sinensis TaxID=4442 RepID=A0A7J7H8Q4_CAMSI|nr:hypothetical protein HYC85_011313 [Camellia sinensis]
MVESTFTFLAIKHTWLKHPRSTKSVLLTPLQSTVAAALHTCHRLKQLVPLEQHRS